MNAGSNRLRPGQEEEAVDDAVGRAEKILDNLMRVSVMYQAVELDQPEREYQAEVEVVFELDEGVGG
jgi:flavin-binding protein dodecin